MTNPDWNDLLQLGVAFRELAPWTWIDDSQVFGVRDSGADQIGWCVVLGAAGEVEGLCVYLGDSGFDTYRQIQDEQGMPEEFWGQDALTLLFGDRDEVSAKQRAIFKEHGFKFRGRGAWPEYAEHRIGFAPRDLPPDQVPFMTQCLKDSIRLAATLRTDPAYLDPEGLLVISGEQVEFVPESAPLTAPLIPRPVLGHPLSFLAASLAWVARSSSSFVAVPSHRFVDSISASKGAPTGEASTATRYASSRLPVYAAMNVPGAHPKASSAAVPRTAKSAMRGFSGSLTLSWFRSTALTPSRRAPKTRGAAASRAAFSSASSFRSAFRSRTCRRALPPRPRTPPRTPPGRRFGTAASARARPGPSACAGWSTSAGTTTPRPSLCSSGPANTGRRTTPARVGSRSVAPTHPCRAAAG